MMEWAGERRSRPGPAQHKKLSSSPPSSRTTHRYRGRTLFISTAPPPPLPLPPRWLWWVVVELDGDGDLPAAAWRRLHRQPARPPHPRQAEAPPRLQRPPPGTHAPFSSLLTTHSPPPPTSALTESINQSIARRLTRRSTPAPGNPATSPSSQGTSSPRLVPTRISPPSTPYIHPLPSERTDDFFFSNGKRIAAIGQRRSRSAAGERQHLQVQPPREEGRVLHLRRPPGAQHQGTPPRRQGLQPGTVQMLSPHPTTGIT